MGKHKGKKRKPVAYENGSGNWEELTRPRLSPGLLAALLGGGGFPAPTRPAKTLAAVLDGAGSSPHVRMAWGVECGMACCDGEHRDIVAVALPSEALVRRHRDVSGNPGFHPVHLTVVDNHRGGQHLTALIDVEDAKRLVNHLGEAIASAEAQGAAVDG